MKRWDRIAQDYLEKTYNFDDEQLSQLSNIIDDFLDNTIYDELTDDEFEPLLYQYCDKIGNYLTSQSIEFLVTSNEYKDWLNDIELEIKQTDKLFMETICPISYESKKEAFKLYLFMFGSDNLAGKKLAEWFEEAKYEYGYDFNDLYGLVLKKGLEQTQNELKDEVKSIMDLEVNFNYEESELVAKDNNNTIELISKIENELKYAIANKGIEWFKENISDTV